METIGQAVSNPAAYGWEWTEPDSGTRFQLAHARGTYTLTLGMRPKGQQEWVDLRLVSAPERFLKGEQPATAKAWRAVVDRWFAAAEDA